MSLPSTPAPVANATLSDQVPCPRCHKPLIDPKGLGWCKACGYCKSLEDTDKKAVADIKPAVHSHVPGAAEGSIMPGAWFWIMLLGVACIVGGTYAGTCFLTLKPFERALLCTLQIAVGMMLMFVGQFIGLLRIAPEEATLSFKDAVFPFRLYGLVFKRLPKTSTTVSFAAWGIAAIFSAVLLIGGLEHWLSYIPSNQKNKGNQTQKTNSAR